VSIYEAMSALRPIQEEAIESLSENPTEAAPMPPVADVGARTAIDVQIIFWNRGFSR
jgi:hypothetical protein